MTEASAAAAVDGPALTIPFDIAHFDDEPIVTERLVLRPLRESDAADVWEYQRIDDVLRYIPWPARTQEEAYAHTATRSAMRSLAADHDGMFFAAVLTGEPSLTGTGDRVIGDFMLRVESMDAAGLEVGWVLHPDFHGRGYATEAAAATLKVAFELLNAHRVLAHLDPRNTASAAICTRLGMRYEGTQLEAWYDKGEWQDGATYAILRQEWDARAH